MLKTSFATLFTCLLLCPSSKGTELTRPETSKPEAVATVGEATYCFARIRNILVERTPAPTLVLQLRIKLTYHNPGSRPLIVPVDHVRTIYTSPAPGVMKPFHEPIDLFAPKVKPMKWLPADVSPDSPVDPPNDTFAVIPAGGDMKPLEEDITMPVYRRGALRQPDLRGHRLYLRVQMTHQELSPDLEAALSDNWSRFGVPWTGTLRTNTLVIDVPAAPEAAACVDK